MQKKRNSIAIALELRLFCIKSSPSACGTDSKSRRWFNHYNDVIMGTIVFQITSLTIVFSTVYLDADQRKHQSSASLAFVRGIHRWSVNSPHKGPVTRKMFPFDDVIMTVCYSRKEEHMSALKPSYTKTQQLFHCIFVTDCSVSCHLKLSFWQLPVSAAGDENLVKIKFPFQFKPNRFSVSHV